MDSEKISADTQNTIDQESLKEEMSTTKFTLKLPQKLKFSSLNKDFLFKPKKERCTQKN